MVDLTRAEWLDAERIADGVQREGPEGFADLCNDILVEVAVRMGASPSCVWTTLSVFEKDEGLDATCVAAGSTDAPWIPDADLVGYQFKSGTNDSSAREVVSNDVEEKAGVMEVLNRGGAFVYITAWDRAAKFEKDIREQAREQGLEEYGEQLHYINGDMIARRIMRLPALIARLRSPDIGGLFTFGEWLDHPRLQNPFKTDDAVESRVINLREGIEESRARLVVVGRPGDGKTRTVRQAVDGSGLEASTLYARNPDHLPQRFLRYLRSTDGVRCTLVVDEVEAHTMRDLEEELGVASSGNVRLVMIGLTRLRREGSDISDLLEIEPLSQDLLQEIVASAVSGLPPESAEDIARICSGSPKLALLLAEQVNEKPELTTKQRLLADRDVQDAIDAALEIELTDPRWRAAGSVALLDYVGWREEDGDESERLFTAADLDVTRSRAAVEEIDRDLGIMPEAGNVRYVSPEVLADHLAAKQIRTWTRGQLQDFLESLSGRLQDGFATRIRTLGDALGDNRAVVEEMVLGEDGPFQTLDDLEQGRTSRVVRQLAGPYRYATLRLLTRVIGPASKEELQAATRCRRDLVRSLEELLWFRETFEESALLLLQLAAAENERWGNNASGIWTETFQTVLGRTAAASNQRVRVLRHAVDSEDPDERRLAAQAIKSGVRFGGNSRMGTPPRELDDAPEEAWQPTTWGEWSELLLEYLDLLGHLLKDPVDEVRDVAVEAMAEAIRSTVMLPSVAGRWHELARTLTDASFDERTLLVRRIRQETRRGYSQLEDSRDDLSEKRIQEIEGLLDRLGQLADELQGSDFESRFRRALTVQYHEVESDIQEARGRIREELRELASEILEDPELVQDQWSWLTEQRPVHVGTWLHELGAEDCDRTLAETVTEVALNKEATWSWLSIYDLGYFDKCIEDDSFVAERVRQLLDQGTPILQVLDFMIRVGYSRERFDLLLGLFREEGVPPSGVARLKYSGWTTEISLDEVRRLVAEIDVNPETTPSVVSFLYGFLRENPTAVEELRELVLNTLAQPVSAEDHQSFDFEWAELADKYASEAPTRVAGAAAARIAQLQVGYDDRLPGLLRTAWREGDESEIFREVLAPWLEEKSTEGWWVRQAISPFPLWELDSVTVCDWIAEDSEHRARAVVSVIGAPSGEVPTDLHACILERFSEYGVGAKMVAELLSGEWVGSAAERTAGLVELAQRWTDDDREAVREWAESAVDQLEAVRERERQRELEEEVRRGNPPPRP